MKIFIPDELVDNRHLNKPKSAKGILGKYANSKLQNNEDTAWTKMVIEKHANR